MRATIAVTEMPHTAMPPIEALGIAPVQAPHPTAQIGFWRFEEEMQRRSWRAMGVERRGMEVRGKQCPHLCALLQRKLLRLHSFSNKITLLSSQIARMSVGSSNSDW